MLEKQVTSTPLNPHYQVLGGGGGGAPAVLRLLVFPLLTTCNKEPAISIVNILAPNLEKTLV